MILGHADTRTDAERKRDAERAFDRGMVASKKLEALTDGEIKKGKAAMSLMGKLNAIKERAEDLTTSTSTALDKLAEKIDETTRKRDNAIAKHHAFYDALGKTIDETSEVIDRLSNLPLGGESSTGG